MRQLFAIMPIIGLLWMVAPTTLGASFCDCGQSHVQSCWFHN